MGVLVSYHYMTRDYLDLMCALRSRGVPTMLDSGAFSAHTLGVSIDLNEYISFCKANGSAFTQYVQLDKIRDAATSKVWLKKMYDAGTTPMPVFTVHEDESSFADFYALSKRICVAGNPTFSSDSWSIGGSKTYAQARAAYSARIERFWREARGDVMLHGLSLTSGTNAWRSRCWSVDSSSWRSGSRFGSFGIFSPSRGIVATHRTELYGKTLSQLKPHVRDFLLSTSTPPARIAKREKCNEDSLLAVLNAESWIRFVLHSRLLGVTVFLASPSLQACGSLAAVCLCRSSSGRMKSSEAQEEAKRFAALAASNRSRFVEEAAQAISLVLADKSRA